MATNRLTPEELDYSLQQLLDGDRSQEEILVKHHMGLCISLARKFARRHPNKSEEIEAAALFGLAIAVRRVAEGALHDSGITPYVYSMSKGYIHKFLQADHLIRVPVRTHQKLEFKPLTTTIAARWDPDNPGYYDNEVDVGPVVEDVHYCEFAQELAKLDPPQAFVASATLDGYKIQEIAEILGCSLQHAYWLREDAHRQYKRRCNYELCG